MNVWSKTGWALGTWWFSGPPTKVWLSFRQLKSKHKDTWHAKNIFFLCLDALVYSIFHRKMQIISYLHYKINMKLQLIRLEDFLVDLPYNRTTSKVSYFSNTQFCQKKNTSKIELYTWLRNQYVPHERIVPTYGKHR